MAAQALYRGTGRRKTAVARVRVLPGDGKIMVNGRDYTEYFPRRAYQASVAAPLRALEAGSSYLSSEDPRVHFGLGKATTIAQANVLCSAPRHSRRMPATTRTLTPA